MQKNSLSATPATVTGVLKPMLPLFPMGRLLITPGARDAIDAAKQSTSDFLTRHVTGDWADMLEDDRELNIEAIDIGTRIFSAYTLLEGGERLFVITEADRSHTTLLLSSEY